MYTYTSVLGSPHDYEPPYDEEVGVAQSPEKRAQFSQAIMGSIGR